MKIKSKVKLLNFVISISVITLIVVIGVAWRRADAQSELERLSKERDAQMTSVHPDEVEETTVKGDLENRSFIYKENKNAQWIAINSDFMGWLKIPGTNIDYPYLRSSDNKDYLTLDIYKKYSDAGSVFMDYRNLGNFNDEHTVIYGHYMKNETMFHNLTYYHDIEYLKSHDVIEISGLYETRTFKIFSVYEISVDDYVLDLNFETPDAYKDYIDSLTNLSMHNTYSEAYFQTLAAEASDVTELKLLTLVTCSYGVENGRTIVHALEILN